MRHQLQQPPTNEIGSPLEWMSCGGTIFLIATAIMWMLSQVFGWRF